MTTNTNNENQGTSNIVKTTIGYGSFLIIWGIVFSIGSDSVTSLIPSFIGIPIFISGVLALKTPAKRKLWMHIAVFFGLLAFLGGFRFFKGLGSPDGLFGNAKAAGSQLMLLITGGIYTAACVKSFIDARKAR